ncbi:MAG: right-handed parallel beta-helix repeat-containing protein [Verrucomicrobiales bacterium]|nr:right-handed parallel beta-helix repeat-containing protein [Verrucomicrobiales bacterium]
MPPKLLLLVFISAAADATDYYLAPRGSDDALGNSPRSAWRTLERANHLITETGLHPGDRILLQGGSTFDGHLVIDNAGGGSKDRPASIGTFGQGPAKIRCGPHTAILVRETPWIVVSNLVLQAGPQNDGDGIRFDRVQTTGRRIPGAQVLRCAMTGFGWHGIMVDASQRPDGYEHVVIADCETSANRHAGIMIYGGNPAGRSGHPHADITVHRCRSMNNLGDPTEFRHHSGSGILIDGVDGALVSECVASGNGFECRSERGGPVGIWAHAARAVIIERSESHGNRSMLRDGGGFDLDGGCEDSVLRWNFSHDNDGPGFMVYTYAGAAYSDSNCRVIGNFSWNDGRKGSGYAGLQIGAEDGCRITHLDVSGNTIIAPPDAVAAVRIVGHNIQARIATNLVLAPPAGVLVAISGLGHRLSFQHNDYWRGDGMPVFLIDTQWRIPSLASWRNSTGPDFRFTAEGDRFLDPGFRGRIPPGRSLRTSMPRWPDFTVDSSLTSGAPLRRPTVVIADMTVR